MGENTAIAWAHHTLNPWVGCTKVGPGCDHCYAERDMDIRRHFVKWGPGQPRRRTTVNTWNNAKRWNRKAGELGIRYRVFCASLADVFDNDVDDEWREDLWNLIEETPNLDWLLLTKRVGNVRAMIRPALLEQLNVWIGATVVNQDEADRDMPKLLALPAAGPLWLSMEPLLGPVNLQTWLGDERENVIARQFLNWVVVGGESGAAARRMDAMWCHELLAQCRAARVPYFFKQGSAANWPDFKNIDAAPAALRVREFPQ